MMPPVRRQRLAAVVFLLVGSGLTIGAVLFALQENVDLFYEPQKVVGGEAPIAKRIRAGGMVEAGSLAYESEGLGSLLCYLIFEDRVLRFDTRECCLVYFVRDKAFSWSVSLIRGAFFMPKKCSPSMTKTTCHPS